MMKLEKSKKGKCHPPLPPPPLCKELPLHHTPTPFLNFFRSLPPKEVIKKGAPNYDITYIYLQPYLT